MTAAGTLLNYARVISNRKDFDVLLHIMEFDKFPVRDARERAFPPPVEFNGRIKAQIKILLLLVIFRTLV